MSNGGLNLSGMPANREAPLTSVDRLREAVMGGPTLGDTKAGPHAQSDQAQAEADRQVLVLSPAYFDSEACRHEFAGPVHVTGSVV